MTTRSENEKAVIEAFTNGLTHAVNLNEDEIAYLKRDVLTTNLVLFGKYVIGSYKAANDKFPSFDDQRMMAKIYTDMILGMLRDFIDCSERGDLDEPE